VYETVILQFSAMRHCGLLQKCTEYSEKLTATIVTVSKFLLDHVSSHLRRKQTEGSKG